WLTGGLPMRSSMLNAAGSKSAYALLGYQHTKRHVMVKRGKRFNDLRFKCHPAAATDEFPLGKKAIIKPKAATDAMTRSGESQTRDNHQVDHVHRNRLAGDRFIDARPG